MSEGYTSMWESLGLDLVAHDTLLEVLGKVCQRYPDQQHVYRVCRKPEL